MNSFKTMIAALTLGLIASVATAGTVTTVNFHDGTPHSGLGNYTGSLSYDTDGILTVELTNTSPLANGGYITGFLFNIDGDATASLATDPDGTFVGMTNAAASPYGSFEFGAAIGGNFNGGGTPTTGIAVGDTRSFVFNVTGTDAGTLSADDFFSELLNGNTSPFIVRFKAFEDGGSDKVPGVHAPTPSAAMAGLAMMGGLAMLRRRRAAKA